MPLHFICQHCGLETLVDDEYAGQSGPCASCGNTIAVPELGPAAELDPVNSSKPTSTVALTVMLLGGCALAFTVTLFLLVGLLFPGVRTLRGTKQRGECARNLRTIGRALAAYQQDHGSFPPAFVTDANGRRMHSWRVLILPYLGQQALYERYDFDQPWDSAANAALTSMMPSVYSCPADPDAAPSGETSYMVVVGIDSAFPGEWCRAEPDIRDDPRTTLLVAEAPVAGVTWLEPKDFLEERMQFTINSGFAQEIGSYHYDGANALMADGTVRFLRVGTPSDCIHAMTTIDRGDVIPIHLIDD